MSTSSINEISSYFNTNWQRYKDSVNKNMLYHLEMYTALNSLLTEYIKSSAITFVDVGCGDCSNIEPVLQGKLIKQYIGIDVAEDVLKMARIQLNNLQCEKKFIVKDMTSAIQELHTPVDIIFSSYAVHHLSLEEKFDFINACKSKLVPGGFFLMIDVIREENQSRDQWLDDMEARFKLFNPDLPYEEIESRMKHPRAADYPEMIPTFKAFAKELHFKDFQVLVNKGMYAFLTFKNDHLV